MKSERQIQELADLWTNNPSDALKEAAIWAARADDQLFEVMAMAENLDKAHMLSASSTLTRKIMLADTMTNMSQAMSAIAQANATAAVAREVHEHGEPILDSRGNPVTH